MSYSPIPPVFVEAAPRCCNDDAVRLEDGTWICVWCSAEVEWKAPYPPRPLPTSIPSDGRPPPTSIPSDGRRYRQ